MASPSLIVYTSRNKRPMPFIRRPELFCYPFPHMVSRTRYKADFFRFGAFSETIDQVTDANVKSLSFQDCALQRADELQRLDKDRYFVLYSGGIDSTGLMVAILKTWSRENLKKIVVVLTSHSILENPSFFKQHILQFPMQNYMTATSELFHPAADSERSIVLTGELGDQIFGSGILMPACQAFGGDILRADYRDSGAKILNEYLKSDSRRGERPGEALFEFLEPIAAECPFPIRTSFDFFWWFNFTQEWQFAKYKFLESEKCSTTTRYGKHITHFYDSLEFQKWSIEQHDRKIGSSWDSYKMANKEFIHGFTQDAFHLRQLKLQSLKNTYFFQSFRVAVNDEYQVVDESSLEQYAR